jgi:dihydrodipicolinate synthase/N-acetylneuraminate lyase
MTRYYLDAGAGGVAVGVHSTQFAIREVGLYEPVLELAMRTAQDWTPLGGRRPLFMVAGLAGGTEQAVREAGIARGLGYHAGLLSLAALKGASEDELVAHCEAVAAVMPLVGFYLQPAVGGIHLPATSGSASPPSTTWWPSRWRRSTATARWTSSAAWSRRARRSA